MDQGAMWIKNIDNVGFVDMTDDFEKMFYEEHHLPHGFSTGQIGVGNINKYGHAVIAESLYRYINELEVEWCNFLRLRSSPLWQLCLLR